MEEDTSSTNQDLSTTSFRLLDVARDLFVCGATTNDMKT